MRRILFYLTFSNFLSLANAQSAADTVIFNALGNYNFSFTYSGYTPVIDRLGRPYVYLATKELGLVTFNISTVSNPVPVDTQTVTSLGNLKVTGVIQDNHYLYASLGDFQGTTQNAGLAVFDVTNPGSPVLLDRWDSAAFNKGTSTVIFQGNYAFLGAMQDGVVILDISNKNDIKFVSQIIPDTTFGNHSYTYHSRGLFISGDTLLVADDNGGLRVINVVDKYHPVEIGKYLSSSISSVAFPFYNNVYRIGNNAFCAVDYCGLEVVNVANPASMNQVSWLNPWDCTNTPPPFGSWNGSAGNTNEISYTTSQSILMVAGGDSQVLAINPSNPSNPQIIGEWGPPKDSVGSWGTDTYSNLVAVANVRTIGFPFVSTVGGLQLLSWNSVQGLNDYFARVDQITVVPNPANHIIEVSTLPESLIEITNIQGQLIKTLTTTGNKTNIDVSALACGVYVVEVRMEEGVEVRKFIKE